METPVSLNEIEGKTIHQDLFEVLDLLPENCVDLLIADPPYNLTKKFNESVFRSSDEKKYLDWLESWIAKLPEILKPTASIYVCCDWRCSHLVHQWHCRRIWSSCIV